MHRVISAGKITDGACSCYEVKPTLRTKTTQQEDERGKKMKLDVRETCPSSYNHPFTPLSGDINRLYPPGEGSGPFGSLTQIPLNCRYISTTGSVYKFLFFPHGATGIKVLSTDREYHILKRLHSTGPPF